MADTKPQLIIRKIPFPFTSDIKPEWNPGKPEWSHMLNGASLTMPYLEPFLIRTVREAAKQLTSEELKSDAQGFMGQEGQHFQNHRRYNDILKAHGYSEIDDVEAHMTADYARIEKKSLKWRLAYSAGFETMTIGIAEWIVNDRTFLLAGADNAVTSLVMWHIVEETEHKNVAYDLFQELYPKDYWMRVYGLFTGSFHLMLLSRRGYIAMLKRDGLWRKFGSRMRLYAMVLRFLRHASPAMIRALRPSYHPSKVTDPEWIKQWIKSYSELPDDAIPLLDTSGPDIKPQFA